VCACASDITLLSTIQARQPKSALSTAFSCSSLLDPSWNVVLLRNSAARFLLGPFPISTLDWGAELWSTDGSGNNMRRVWSVHSCGIVNHLNRCCQGRCLCIAWGGDWEEVVTRNVVELFPVICWFRYVNSCMIWLKFVCCCATFQQLVKCIHPSFDQTALLSL
jgi:hypothetical protein